MYIMTRQGYKPLVSFDAYWQRRHDRLEAARKAYHKAMAMPARTTDECKARHVASMAAFAHYSKCLDAMLGA